MWVVTSPRGAALLRPGDAALFLGEAAALPDPEGVTVYRDEADGALPGARRAEEIIALLFAAERVISLG